MRDETKDQLIKWLISGKTGASSEAIASFMVGEKCNGNYPHDAGDFGRCEGLLDAVPEFRARLPEMSGVNRYWASLISGWEKIRSTPDAQKNSIMQEILRPIEKSDAGIIRMGAATIRFGEIK